MAKRLSRFWQELKRRNVHRSLAIYGGTAFVVLEAADIIFPRWGLPDWTIDLVMYLLILGAVITIVVSWVFDITPKGVEKTRPLSELVAEEQRVVPNGWKIATYVSIIVIVGLIIFNLAGGFNKIRTNPIQSVVILPFDNFTGDDELDYFVSGMHSSLIGDMGQISGLRVISKTSSNAYKEMDMSVPDLASELNVDAVVEGTVLCLGDSICVQFKLISAYPEEEQLWIGEFKEERSQILSLYDRVTKQISDEVKVKLTPQEESSLAEANTVDTDAYDAYMMGQYFLDQLGEEELEKAIEYFNKAIEIDPDWAPPYTGLAEVGSYQKQMGFVTPYDPLPMMYENLSKALQLDPNSANSHYENAVIATWTEWNWEKAEKEFLRALELNPNNALCHVFYAHLLMTLQRPEEAMIHRKLAQELDPMRPFILALCAVVMIDEGDFQSAIELLERAVSLRPDHFFALSILESAYYFNGQYDKSFELMKFFISLNFGEEFVATLERIFRDQGYFAVWETLADAHEEAARDRYQRPMGLADLYMGLNKHEKALDWLEKGFEVRDPSMPYIITGIYSFEPLFKHPRFMAILEKMDLPLPTN